MDFWRNLRIKIKYSSSPPAATVQQCPSVSSDNNNGENKRNQNNNDLAAGCPGGCPQKEAGNPKSCPAGDGIPDTASEVSDPSSASKMSDTVSAASKETVQSSNNKASIILSDEPKISTRRSRIVNSVVSNERGRI
jgi:hypothetical protein